jgi:hypothetical protein
MPSVQDPVQTPQRYAFFSLTFSEFVIPQIEKLKSVASVR